MKQKLTVLACVGLALLLSTGIAFAQNTITVETKDVARCATVSVGIDLTNAGPVQAIGIPLVISGDATYVSAASAARLAGFMTADNQSGSNILLNAAGVCLGAGSGNIWTLNLTTGTDCQGNITIDQAMFPPVPTSGLMVVDCDACEQPVDFVAGVLTLVNNTPTCGTNSNVSLHFTSEIVDKALNASDADACDNLTYAMVSGPGSIASGTNLYSWNPDCADVATSPHLVTFSATDDCGATVNCSFEVTVTQNDPVCQGVGAQSVHWSNVLSVPLPATDDGCPLPLAWSVVDNGGLTGPLSVAGGTLNYSANCADIGVHVVEYQVTDGVGTDNCTIEITVTNTAPYVTQCDNVVGDLIPGDLQSGDINAQDDEGDGLTYTLISFTHIAGVGPGTPNNSPVVNSATGEWIWQTESANNNDLGTWELCVEVSDGCYTDVCCLTIDVVFNFTLCIGGAPLEPVDSTIPSYVVDTIPSLPGQTTCAYVNIHDGYALGGLDLLIGYDQSGLSVVSVNAIGGLLEWEYFTYRTSANSNCSGGCPTGLLRIVSIADLDNGPDIHPGTANLFLDGYIAEICFYVTNDWNFLGQCLPINFYSIDCGDNLLSSATGDTVFAAQGVAAECLDDSKGRTVRPIIDLCGGSICLREPKDDRGDINLNGIRDEIADAVLYSRYFIEGAGVLDPVWHLVQTQASDVNNDGVPWTIADLVYMIRIITGDEMPFPNDAGNPKVSPFAGEADAVVNVSSNRVTVSTHTSADLGGAVFVFRYSGLGVGKAELTEAASQMTVASKADRGELRVLVTPQMVSGARVEAGTNDLVTIPISGEGTIELVEVQLADANGAMLTSTVAKVAPPTSYALLQNYPNPFNAGTVIRFDLKEASDWTLNVYNIAGQLVRSFSGHDEASQVNVSWDGNTDRNDAAASGVYFYSVKAGNFTATKKMTLLK